MSYIPGIHSKSPNTQGTTVTMTMNNAGNASVNVRMTRNGRYATFSGAVAIGSSLPTGNIQLNMPTGLTINTSLSLGLSNGVSAGGNSGGTSSFTGAVRVETSSILSFYGDSGASVWNGTVPRTFAANDRIDFIFTVAINEWSSNDILKISTETKI